MELMTCSVFGLLYNVSVGLPESYAVRVALEVNTQLLPVVVGVALALFLTC